MPTLNVVMIVKDEAACLGDCLESVRGIADTMIIGDTGSTDDTVAIATRFGARVIDVPWNDDFAAARNAVIDAADGDWLLHLDADEALDPDVAKRIRDLVDVDGAGADAVELTLANYCNAPRAWRWVPADPASPWSRGHAGYIAVPLLRLFRNRPDFRYREPVHENITESVGEAGGVVRAEPILIHHYGYAETTPEKGRRYLAIAQRKVELRPDDPKAWHDLAEQHLALDNAADAEEACRNALAIDPTHLGAGTTLANILLGRGTLDEARALLLGFDQGDVTPAHVDTALAAIALRQGRMDEAAQRTDRAVSTQPDYLMGWLERARVYDVTGDETEARQSLETAQRLAPGIHEIADRINAHNLRQQAVARFREGAHAEALAGLVEALQRDPEDPLIHRALGDVITALGDATRAQQSYDRAYQLAPSLKR